MMNNGFTQVLNLLFGIMLGRLLTPSDYGMVGVLAIFSAIAGNLQSFGFTQALTNMKAPSARDYNAVFWFNTISGFSLYAVLFFCAPLIARFFHQPELTEVSRFVFLCIPISALGIAHNAYMFKQLMVKQITIIGFAALLASGTAGVALAFSGMGYWSLAWQQVVFITVVNIGRYAYTPWHPSWNIDMRPIKGMFSFSVKILFTSILNTLSGNLLVFIFGHTLPMKTVGNFSQANKWNTMAYSFITGTVAQVAQPVMAQINDDGNRERRVFRKMTRFTAMLSFPTMFGLALIAPEFILLTIKDKWIDCIPILQQLCIWGAFLPITTLCSHLLISRGKSNLNLYSNIILGCIQIAALLVSWRYGLPIMISTYVAINIIWMSVWYMMVRKEIKLKFTDAMKDICPFILITIVSIIAAKLVCSLFDSRYIVLAMKIIITAILYLGISRLANAKIQDEIFSYLLKRKIK